MPQDRPWDVRLIERMQRRRQEGPVTRGDVVWLASLTAVVAALSAVMGLGWWPPVGGGLVALVTGLWQRRSRGA